MNFSLQPKENHSMKTKSILAALLWLAMALLCQSQPYTLDWWTMDSGGGTSSGGLFSVTGSIGQPDAGAMSGGGYLLTGGFWSIYAVQTPSAPLLSIQVIGDTVMVSWPSLSTGFNLQVNTELATTNWVTPAETVQDNGSIRYLRLTPATGNRFYRLKNPLTLPCGEF
jgi:hypothetical protein